MPLLGGLRLIANIMAYRIVHIEGRLAGGKTSLAVRLNMELCSHGYRFGSNLKCIFNEPLSAHLLNEDNMLKSAFIIDEGGLYFKERGAIDAMLAYAGKMDMTLLIPSFQAPHRSARIMRIQPVWNLYGFGFPYVHYKWHIKSGSTDETGSFGWLFPEEIYGVYSRQAAEDDAEKIVNHIVAQSQAKRLRDGYKEASNTVLGYRPSAYLPAFDASIEAEPQLSVGGVVSVGRSAVDTTDLLDDMDEKIERLETVSARASSLLKKARRNRRLRD